MKYIKTLVASLLLLATTINQSGAQTIAERNTTDLVQQMAGDYEVLSFLKTKMKISLTDSYGKSFIDQHPDQYQQAIDQVNESKAIIEGKYPAYAQMSLNEKQSILNDVLKVSGHSSFWTCYYQALTKMLTCAGIVSAGSWAAIRFGICASAAAGAEALSEGAQSAAVPAELTACLVLAGAGATLAADCVDKFMTLLWAC